MWCKSCRQEMPAVADVTGEKSCCVRCGAAMPQGAKVAPAPMALAKQRATRTLSAHVPMRTDSHDSSTILCDAPTVTIRAPLSAFDTWELEEQLRHVDRILSGARFSTELADIVRAAESAPAA
jgi:hypothetical protein